MHLSTAESIELSGEQAAIHSWTSALGAPLLSRTVPNTELASECPPQNSSLAKAKRQVEFATGRRCAESLLKRLGNTEQVWTNPDRSPAWPVGFTGSISHSKHWTWAVVAEQPQLLSVGIDTEPLIDQTTREEIVFEIATPSEWEACQQFDLTADQIFSIVFSAKEAFYKCCYPIVQQYFGFEHAVVETIEADRVKIRTHQSHPCIDKMPESMDVFYRITPKDVFTITVMESK